MLKTKTNPLASVIQTLELAQKKLKYEAETMGEMLKRFPECEICKECKKIVAKIRADEYVYKVKWLKNHTVFVDQRGDRWNGRVCPSCHRKFVALSKRRKLEIQREQELMSKIEEIKNKENERIAEERFLYLTDDDLVTALEALETPKKKEDMS